MTGFKLSLTSQEESFLLDAYRTGDIGEGKYISKFEEAWSNYNTKKYGVACNSGTSALYLALLALGVGPGDEVIVPEFTMISTAWAVTYTGATPVFVDCDDTLNIDPELIAEAVTDKTKAIIPVHIYGRRCNMEAINEIAVENDLYVVEDMAEAHGIKPIGDIACYSFYSSKIIGIGNGGMCLTDNVIWASEMRKLANLYLDKERTMIHEKVGHNLRMTNLHAAIGYGQVSRICEILKKRKQIEKWFDKHVPEEYKRPNRDVLWMYDINYTGKTDDMRYAFRPMSEQPMYRVDYYPYLKAYKYSKTVRYLVVWTDMTEEDVKEICSQLK